MTPNNAKKKKAEHQCDLQSEPLFDRFACNYRTNYENHSKEGEIIVILQSDNAFLGGKGRETMAPSYRQGGPGGEGGDWAAFEDKDN